jgi:hypothetical protein
MKIAGDKVPAGYLFQRRVMLRAAGFGIEAAAVQAAAGWWVERS